MPHIKELANIYCIDPNYLFLFLQKNLKKMKELFRCLKEDGINPDVTTYALLLSCLGQQEVSENNTQIIRLYLEDISKEVSVLLAVSQVTKQITVRLNNFAG